MSTGKWSRRDFLKCGAAAAAVGVVAPRSLVAQETGADDTPEFEYRTLGRTGLQVTAVSIGCMVAPEPVIVKAFEMGVNWFDTAHSYKVAGEPSEQAVGRVLKGKRDKAYICTKVSAGSPASMLNALETSLQRLQTDHVDLLLIHGASSRGAVLDPNAMEALQQAKQSGKTRFIGVSTHSNMAECINAAVGAKIYDAVLTAYNFEAPQPLKDAVAAAKSAGVGIIAMKTQRGNFASPAGGLTPHQAALKWVLDDPNVTCAIPGIRSFTQLESNMAVMRKRLTYFDRRRLERYAAATAGMYCIGCGECAGTCPFGVDIPEVRRCAMYLDGYRDMALARENYRLLHANAARCLDCATCSARCVRRVALQPTLRDTHRRLA